MGIDLTELGLEMQVLAGYFPNSNISPYVHDGFLYGGFDFIFDNSAKWSEEDIAFHSNNEELKNIVLGLLSRK